MLRALLLLPLLAACSGQGEPRLERLDAAPVAWGEETCASCQMVVREPRFAAQCRTADGEVRSFDDLGCLVLEIEMRRLQPRSVHFRHVREDRWIPAEQARFVRHEETPMPFGYAAVDAEEGELGFAEVRAEMRSRFELGG